MNPAVESFFDPTTNTISHVVFDEPHGTAAIVDPVLDYDPKSGRTHTTQADRIISFIKENDLHVSWILETHAHADHLSSAQYLRRILGGKVSIGEHINSVQYIFKQVFNLEESFATDGRQFDHLFKDNESFSIGKLSAKVIAVPGHTPADVAYQIGNSVFIGDTLFMPDTGTARCDFPKGDARTLYQSIQRLFALPPETLLYLCHDYVPETAQRNPQWVSSVAEQKAHNIHVHQGISIEEFIALRTARDKTLEMPTLIAPAVQVNIRAGHLPPVENNGTSYLKIPINTL